MTPASPGPVQVMLCDDSATVRAALMRILAADPGIRVVARAAEGRDPSDATPEILRAQLAAREPIQPAELVPCAGEPAPLHCRLGAEEMGAAARFLADLAARLSSLADAEKAS